MSEGKVFDDLANALLRLRAAFKKHGLEPPVSIELARHEDGTRLKHCLPRDMVLAQPSMGRSDESPDIVMNVVGVEIRYPAQFRARERGGFDIVD